jgi:hypothetical protein
VSRFIYCYADCRILFIVMLSVAFYLFLYWVAFYLFLGLMSSCWVSFCLMSLCWVCYDECHYAECVMLSVIMLSVLCWVSWRISDSSEPNISIFYNWQPFWSKVEKTWITLLKWATRGFICTEVRFRIRLMPFIMRKILKFYSEKCTSLMRNWPLQSDV